MGDPSDDDVPTVTSAVGDESAADADDRTIQEAPGSEPDADPTTALVRPPVPPMRPRAETGPEPPTAPTSLAAEDEAEDSITATAPRVSAPKLPLGAPQSVEIRTLDDEDDENGEETELRTLVGVASAPAPKLPSVVSEADAADDSVTAQAPAAGAPSPGPIRISPKSLMPSTGAAASAAPSDVYEDDSVTSRGPAVGSDYADDSITTQAPNMPAKIASAGVALPPPIDGETEGTTKKVRKGVADEDAESITTQAPGHLTNMLRVIASDKNAPDDDDPDDPVQAHTQVMANAPLKPSDLGAHVGRGGAALAQQLEPSSESGLRIAHPERMDADRASLGAIGVPARERRISNMAVIGGRDPSRSKPTQPPSTYVPSDADGEKKPPYALVVGVVALISIAIPAVLFIVLNQGTGELAPRVTAQPTPDPVTRGDAPRARATKPSAAPSATAPKRPFRR